MAKNKKRKLHKEYDEKLLQLSKQTHDNWKLAEHLYQLSDDTNNAVAFNEQRAKAMYYFVLREVRYQNLASSPKYMRRFQY